MSKVVSTLGDAIEYINFLYESDSNSPTEGDENFVVWTGLINIAINLWEKEEGLLWKELFAKLADTADGDKTITAGDYSYAVPALFRFPASGIVWLGTGTNKTPFKVIDQKDLTLYENNSDNWCYFLMDTSPTLEFNPNCTLTTGDTINYNYYKFATKLTTSTDALEMSDPMFAVYYVLSELKKEEGDITAGQIASQKLEAMKTNNIMPTNYQDNSFLNNTNNGFGV